MLQRLNQLDVLVHGESPRPMEMLILYATGVIGGLFLVVQAQSTASSLTIPQMIVLFILALDVIGGVIANITRSTSTWYHQRPLHTRMLFLLMHFVHPMVAVMVLDPGNWFFFWRVYLYMLLAGGMVLLIRNTETQRPVALALYVIGLMLAIYLLQPADMLRWFAPVYFAKLIICFAVDHYEIRTSTG